MLRNSLQRRLRMEMLEDKRPLAANLIVEVIDGDLVITGDAGKNSFEIQSGLPGGAQYELINLAPALYNELDHTINGVPFFQHGDHYFSGVTGDIIINLGDGNDSVVIEGTNGVDILEMPGDLRIDLGSGDDGLVLGTNNSPIFGDWELDARPLAVAGDLVIDMGAGTDMTWAANTLVGDDFSYRDTEGDAILQFIPLGQIGSNSFESEIGDDFSVVTGGGAENVGLEDMNVGGDLLLSVAGGDDVTGLTNVDVGGSTLVSLGAGFNSTEIQLSNLGSSLTVLASGSNSIGIVGVVTTNSVMVNTSNGDDFVGLGEVQTGVALVNTGAGVDEMLVVDSVFDHLLANLGGGADSLTIGGTTVNGLALLLGGGGADTLIDTGGNDILLELDLGFESLVS